MRELAASLVLAMEELIGRWTRCSWHWTILEPLKDWLAQARVIATGPPAPPKEAE